VSTLRRGGRPKGCPAIRDLAGSVIDELHDGELIDLSGSAKILRISSDHVRSLIRRGYLEKAGERPSRSRHTPAILVRRADVERLADQGWPGRVGPRPRARHSP
jgi:hypothetical protein